MHLLHVFDHSLPLQSGYAFRSRAILEGQRALGLRTLQATSSKHGYSASAEDIDGLRFHRTAPGRFAGMPILDNYDVIRSLERRLREILEREPVDLVHGHSPCLTGIAAWRASRAFGLPFVYEMRALWEDAAVDHGTTRRGSLRYRAAQLMETRLLRRADAIACICEGLKGEIVRRGIAAERVTVVPNAVDIDRFMPARSRDAELAQQMKLDGGPTVGFIGSLYRYEGVDLLLQAMGLLHRRRPDIALVIVGSGPEEAALKAQTQKLSFPNKVLAVGSAPHSQIARYYSLVDLLVYPRRRTRLTEIVTPLKPLEGMAQGKLVLASDIGGHRELIRHGETGILFAPDDPDAIATTIAQMLEVRAAWPDIAAAARSFVERERNWRRSVALYAQIYSEAAERHSHPRESRG